ncbi:hypothetical protein RUND412_008222 [Rhizina undulata]
MEDQDRLENALGELFAYSLAKRKNSNDSFWIHPLVHMWTREHIDGEMLLQNAEHALTLVTSVIPGPEHNLNLPLSLPAYKRSSDDLIFERRILSHLRACQEILAYANLGFYDQAEASYQIALAGHEEHPGSDRPLTLRILNRIAQFAWVFNQQGRYDKTLLQRALSGKERALGKDHPLTLTTVNCVAITFDKQGRHEEALKLFQRVLEVREKVLGKDHPDTLKTIHSVALVFRNQGRYDEALEWLQRAFAGFEKALRKDHPSTLNTVNDMGSLFGKQGRYDEAFE